MEVGSKRIEALVKALEMQLFGAGLSDAGRTELVLSALLERPAVKRLLGNRTIRTPAALGSSRPPPPRSPTH